MTEVQAALSFDRVRKGTRLQVDIHDPKVVALVAAGYYKIIWRDCSVLDHRTGLLDLPCTDLVSGVEEPEQVDGNHHLEQTFGAGDSSEANVAVGAQNNPADPDRGETAGT